MNFFGLIIGPGLVIIYLFLALREHTLEYKERQKYFSGQIKDKEVQKLKEKRNKSKFQTEPIAVNKIFC